MSKKIFYSVLMAAVMIAASPCVSADDGADAAYSPYSIFAIGDMVMPGTAYHRSMAGVGIASRNNKYINILNPAAVTARDSLAFMLNFSLFGQNKVYKQNSGKSAHNSFSIGDGVISFPIYKSSAMMLGIMQYSNTGYGYQSSYSDPAVIADYGNTTYSATGIGSVYQAFAGAGVTFFKRLSVGAEAIMYFGNITKNNLLSYGAEDRPDVDTKYVSNILAFTGKFGLQYEQPLGSLSKLCLGATYRLGNNVGGYQTKSISSTNSTSVVDTLSKTPGRLKMASEFGLGLSYNFSDKFRAEFDWTRSDWRKTNFNTDPFYAVKSGSVSFSTALSQSFRAGFEYVPNRNDIRYYMKKVAYRAGAYYTTDYYSVAGQQIISKGITVGATFPIYRWHNGFTVGFDFGTRGTVKNNLVKENYFNFSVAVDLFDIWFQKPRYE